MGIAKSIWRLLGVSEKFERRWIVASNRLPVCFNRNSQKLELSSGGLVSAISGIHHQNEIFWLGTAAEPLSYQRYSKAMEGLPKVEFHPVTVSLDKYNLYYNGMCNKVLWPLLNFEPRMADFDRECWHAYCEVNQIFAREILRIAGKGDFIWIHDFHLLLLGKYIKAEDPQRKVGFFLHTPFPSTEIFRQLPVRNEILEAVLSCDLVGFHDYSYLCHFANAVQQQLGLPTSLMSIAIRDHTASLGVFPVSIDTSMVMEQAKQVEVKRTVEKFWRGASVEYVILGIDRLDYIKGITLKLRAYREFLRSCPEFQGKVCLLQLAVPSRTDVPDYIEYRKDVEQLVGEINGAYGNPNYVPVQYFFRAAEVLELLGLYRLADVLLVTSRRDGMNLVALEYIAAQDEMDPGVVVLSEFTGAVSTLSHALRINPYDVQETSAKIREALIMEGGERVRRHNAMLRYLMNYTATHWAHSFMRALEREPACLSSDSAKTLSQRRHFATLFAGLKSASSLVIFLDFDGTLAEYRQHAEEVTIDEVTRNILSRVCENPNVSIVIVSGRTKEFLLREFQNLNVELAAEHGAAFYRREKMEWLNLTMHESHTWFELARQVLDDYTSRVPDSFVEQKEFSLVWQFRRSPQEFAQYQALRLKRDLDQVLANMPANAILGNKILEVRSIEANKGVFVRWYLANFHSERMGATLLALGDDVSDEEMFRQVTAFNGVTIKIGAGATTAAYRLSKQSDIIPLLKEFEGILGIHSALQAARA